MRAKYHNAYMSILSSNADHNTKEAFRQLAELCSSLENEVDSLKREVDDLKNKIK